MKTDLFLVPWQAHFAKAVTKSTVKVTSPSSSLLSSYLLGVNKW